MSVVLACLGLAFLLLFVYVNKDKFVVPMPTPSPTPAPSPPPAPAPKPSPAPKVPDNVHPLYSVIDDLIRARTKAKAAGAEEAVKKLDAIFLDLLPLFQLEKSKG